MFILGGRFLLEYILSRLLIYCHNCLFFDPISFRLPVCCPFVTCILSQVVVLPVCCLHFVPMTDCHQCTHIAKSV